MIRDTDHSYTQAQFDYQLKRWADTHPKPKLETSFFGLEGRSPRQLRQDAFLNRRLARRLKLQVEATARVVSETGQDVSPSELMSRYIFQNARASRQRFSIALLGR